MNLKQIIARMKEIVSEMRKINEGAVSEKRTKNETEVKQYDALKSEMDALKEQRESIEEMAEYTRSIPEEEKAEDRHVPGHGSSDTDIEVGKDLEADRGFSNFGEQLQCVANAARSEGRVVDRRLLALNKRASGGSEGVPSDGGFLVQQDFSQEIVKIAHETGQVASRCNRVPIGQNSNGLSMNTIDESSRVNGSRYGGVQAYWEAEADSTTASKPKFGRMDLKLQKLFGLYYATDELMADSTALGAIVSEAFSSEIAYKLDDAIINGDGSGKPMGILNSGALVTQAKKGSQSADTVLWTNISSMWSRCHAMNRRNAVWLINQDIEPQLDHMTVNDNVAGAAVYVPAGGASGTPYATLKGRPVIPVEQCATLGDAGDVILADLSQYLLIDKSGVQADTSMHVKFLTDEMTFRWIYRVNGQPMWRTALTPAKGSNTTSPFVTLAARA